MRHGLAILGAALLTAGCSSADELGGELGVEQQAASGDETAQEVLDRRLAGGASAEVFTDNEDVPNGERTFSYAWPAQVTAIPALAEELESRRKAALEEQKGMWAESLEMCPEDAISCRNMSFDLDWQVVADLPRFLSLSNGFSSYTGGAHGINGRGSLVWDREEGRAVEPVAMFASPAALEGAIAEAACKALNTEREKRRGAPVPAGDTDWFNACVGIEETVVFLGSSNGRTFDRLGVYYGPYVAGAYAEGDFEFTLPVTQAVVAAVKPEYRGAFSAR